MKNALRRLIALVAAEGWTEYAEDAERTYRALSGRGVTTLVALADQRGVGAIQVQSDGVIQAHVSMLLIDRQWRGHRLGSRLLREGLERIMRGRTGALIVIGQDRIVDSSPCPRTRSRRCGSLMRSDRAAGWRPERD